jgi:outer membrane lipoprotein
MRKVWLLPVLALAVSACATIPKPIAGDIAPTSPNQGVSEGARVRWGGSIIVVEPKPDETCFQILGRDLGANARPRESDNSAGRFIACRQGFYDPAIFTQGRELTIVGTVAGTESRKIGEYDYRLPRVNADVVYLWPERVDYYDTYYPAPSFYWWPYFGPPVIHYRHPHPRGKEVTPEPVPPPQGN